ncbi:hypothetical protein V6N11_024332 [Hibiscus sabdariffa]|uniref:Uncharacterized protein n=1 Tax=Hibiscus sabdariffa TaxID=183260 RepID=A0ABR1ZAW8_9ROSI
MGDGSTRDRAGEAGLGMDRFSEGAQLQTMRKRSNKCLVWFGFSEWFSCALVFGICGTHVSGSAVLAG